MNNQNRKLVWLILFIAKKSTFVWLRFCRHCERHDGRLPTETTWKKGICHRFIDLQRVEWAENPPVLVTGSRYFYWLNWYFIIPRFHRPANATPHWSWIAPTSEELEDLFNEQLVLLYAVGLILVMDDPNLMQRRWCHGVPFIERVLFPVVFPCPLNCSTELNITPESVAQTQNKSSIFEQVSELWWTPTWWRQLFPPDITFAALVAPAVAPEGTRVRRSNLQELPPKMASEISAFRKTSGNMWESWI